MTHSSPTCNNVSEIYPNTKRQSAPMILILGHGISFEMGMTQRAPVQCNADVTMRTCSSVFGVATVIVGVHDGTPVIVRSELMTADGIRSHRWVTFDPASITRAWRHCVNHPTTAQQFTSTNAVVFINKMLLAHFMLKYHATQHIKILFPYDS